MLPLWSLYGPVNEAAVRIGCQSVWHLFVLAGEEWNKTTDQINTTSGITSTEKTPRIT